MQGINLTINIHFWMNIRQTPYIVNRDKGIRNTFQRQNICVLSFLLNLIFTLGTKVRFPTFYDINAYRIIVNSQYNELGIRILFYNFTFLRQIACT